MHSVTYTHARTHHAHTRIHARSHACMHARSTHAKPSLYDPPNLSVLLLQVGPLVDQYDIYTPCVNGSTLGLSCENYTAAISYLNREDVREALHVSPNVTHKWSTCFNVNYGDSWPTVLNIYPLLMKSMRVTVLFTHFPFLFLVCLKLSSFFSTLASCINSLRFMLRCHIYSSLILLYF